MKKKLFFLVLLTLIVFLPKNVKADCTDAEMVRLQKLANNVNVNYTYNEKTNNFEIVITNLKKELRIEYINTLKKYISEGEIKISKPYSGTHTFLIYSNNKKCFGEFLTTKYVELPFLNPYADEKICKGIESYVYCKKWNNINDNKEIYYKKILEYKKKISENKIKKDVQDDENFIIKYIKEKYVEYYYIILPVIISLLSVIIYIKNKKESLT